MDEELAAAIAAAAAERGKAVVTRADRPSSRRSAEVRSSGPRVAARSTMLVRAAGDGGSLDFEGNATVYEREYEMWDYFGPYSEVVTAGAGALSLARADLDVPLVLQHQDLRRIARTTNGSLTLEESEEALRVLAPNLDPQDQDVAYIVPKLRAGLVDEMSFKFRITSGVWSPDWTQYRINSYDIHRGDVAIVGYGASPHTAGSGLRAADVRDLIRTLDDDEAREALAVLRARLDGPAPHKRGRDLVTFDDERLLALI